MWRRFTDAAKDEHAAVLEQDFCVAAPPLDWSSLPGSKLIGLRIEEQGRFAKAQQEHLSVKRTVTIRQQRRRANQVWWPQPMIDTRGLRVRRRARVANRLRRRWLSKDRR